jgi:hypothetical protein
MHPASTYAWDVILDLRSSGDTILNSDDNSAAGLLKARGRVEAREGSELNIVSAELPSHGFIRGMFELRTTHEAPDSTIGKITRSGPQRRV